MNSIGRWLSVALVAWSASAAAQEIQLFENDNYSGRRFASNGSVQDLDSTGFNDRASSVLIRAGQWQLCSDAYYRGRCATLGPGNYPSLRSQGLNRSVSSIREVGWTGGGGVPGGGGGFVGGSVTLYEGTGLSGRSITVNQPMPNLDGTGFNDRAQSAVVSAGTWQLCVDADFQSTCEVFRPGQYGDLAGVSGRVSSMRPIGGGGQGGGGQGGGWSGGGWGGNTRVVLYESPNFGGRSMTVTNDVVPNLAGSGFNDRASSIRVERGYWMFCSDADFQGQCRTFGPGDYPNLPPGFSNQISSGRRISNDYPYNAAPRWQN